MSAPLTPEEVERLANLWEEKFGHVEQWFACDDAVMAENNGGASTVFEATARNAAVLAEVLHHLPALIRTAQGRA